ncbi:GMC family oxidoreductase [Synechococcus sp. EJ6-Ellesmere]|uniref:GMC family oxidoreductase n=1 Tax=Synechococcus sp. EJ6-Ellesmere TaxID=2823734 RepID=UPI0020CE53BB|nr:GMC family oxidoreductase N-terminal domain-containing protein [Synechococcus sp. EJ6-Ellesmere]MCP9826773.1 GMC family oxidoreductase N-terminal domain-containing protein [Synechococcus sp. EJ6-Ellesmere]
MSAFDFIVIGGGNAGAVIAARLSEDSTATVLLIEAGPHYRTIQETPADLLDSRAVSVESHDWNYITEVIPGREFAYARGKVTGGCSAVNGCISLRGLKQDFREWAALGNKGWDWEDILPLYKRIEDDRDFGYASHHGSEGRIPIQRFKPNEYSQVVKGFCSTAMANGYHWVPDHNHPRGYDGVGPIPMNRAGDGTLRISSSIAYLLEAQTRNNLTIMDKTLARKVVFHGKRATGVEVVTASGSVETIQAGEVIISCGAIHSPALLLRSGIGPKIDLDPLGIKCVNELQGVGSNLIDHSLAVVAAYPKSGVVHESDDDVQMVIHYTAPGSSHKNDMQIYCLGKLGAERFPGADPTRGLMFGAGIVINRPESRGRITLESADPNRQPRIDHRLNSHAEDMRKMVDGVRRGYQLLNSGELGELSEGVAVINDSMIDDTRALERYVTERSATIWHAIGTCKMGPSTDNHAVVDSNLKVHDCKNLRVADCSIFPDHVSRNPMLTCYVVAEKAVDSVLAGS